jgi:hypothetical protein
VGYASPRWAGAKSAEEADRLNFALSTRRAETVQEVMEKLLRKQLGDARNLPFQAS